MMNYVGIDADSRGRSTVRIHFQREEVDDRPYQGGHNERNGAVSKTM